MATEEPLSVLSPLVQEHGSRTELDALSALRNRLAALERVAAAAEAVEEATDAMRRSEMGPDYWSRVGNACAAKRDLTEALAALRSEGGGP